MLLSLPDDALERLFAFVSARPGVALCSGARDAHALAAAHPRLDRLYRHDVVTRLELYEWVSTKTRWNPDALASEVQRMLQRHPRATALKLALDLVYKSERPFLPSPVDIVAYAAPRLKVFELTGVDLSCGGVRALLARCRGLEELKLHDCRPGLDDDELGAVVSAAGTRLRVLSLVGSADKVTDAGGARLCDLTALVALHLGKTSRLRAIAFHAVAALPALTSLSLVSTRFSDEHAAATLPRMRKLRELNVSGCDAVGNQLWAALPPTLRKLLAYNTALLDKAPSGACAAALVELCCSNRKIPFGRTRRRRTSWWALVGPHVRTLRVLRLDYSDDLIDMGADAALASMPDLKTLDVRLCRNIGDGTAAAVSRHAALRFVDFRGTGVCPKGTRALRRWEADGNNAAMPGERSTAGTIPHGRTLCL